MNPGRSAYPAATHRRTASRRSSSPHVHLIPANSVLEFQMVLVAFKSVAEIEAMEAAEKAAADKPAAPANAAPK